ncbi:MAG: hypothetical protein PVJ19_18160 [Desulfobacteraceae bacterium]
MLLPEHKNILKQIAWKLGKIYAIDPKSCSKGIEICQKLHGHGISTTIGKFSKDGDMPEEIVRECLQCTASIKSDFTKNNFYLSLKPPAFQFNPDYVKNIAAVSLKNGHGIHFDSHDHILAEPTLQLLKHSLDDTDVKKDSETKWHYGLTLPSRWKRSLSDAQWAVQNGIRVRLVKGEFKAKRSYDEMNPIKGYLALVDRLTGSVPEIAIATHDYRLAKEAIIRARDNDAKVQLELLFGMPSVRMVALSKKLRVPLRFYVAYGDTLLLYGLRHHLTTPYKLFRPDAMEVFGSHKRKLNKIIHSL